MYTLNELAQIQVLSNELNRLSAELGTLTIYAPGQEHAVEMRESDLQRIFGQIHALVLGSDYDTL